MQLISLAFIDATSACRHENIDSNNMVKLTRMAHSYFSVRSTPRVRAARMNSNNPLRYSSVIAGQPFPSGCPEVSNRLP